jgi:hypothetical protein
VWPLNCCSAGHLLPCQSWVSRPNSMRKGVYISDFQVRRLASFHDLWLRYSSSKHR